MKDNKRLILGGIILLIGIVGLLNKVFDLRLFAIRTLWPLIILSLGLLFEFAYFEKRKAAGLLVPGGILTTIGLLFMFENITNWRFSGYTWPVYPFAVAVGLFQLYLFGGRKRGLLIPVGILVAVSGISLASIILGDIYTWINTSLIGPVVFVIIGLFIIFGATSKKKVE